MLASVLSALLLLLCCWAGEVRGYITFTALNAAAPWEARNGLGYGISTVASTYTPVGSTTSTTLPAGSYIMYAGSNLLPSNPNNGSNTYSTAEHDV